MRSSFLKFSLLLAVIGFFASCDKDYNEIGSGIVDDDHFGFDLHTSPVVAHNQFYGAVQTSKTSSSASTDIAISTLGSYNNPYFGKVTASFLTQVVLKNPNQTFNLDPQVSKVELNVPYFSTMTDTDDDGNHLYELDSLQGSSKIKLSVYPSGYYLRDFDPGTGGPGTGFQQIQRYYSDQTAELSVFAGPRLNDSSDPKQNDEFYFDPAEIVTYTTDEDGLQVVDDRRPPEMRLQLRNDFFQEKLFSPAASGKLVSNNVFKEWLRGIHFKVESAASSPNQGTLNKINFNQGTITVTYTERTSEADPTRTAEKTLTLQLGGNDVIGHTTSVNLFENEFNSNYFNAVNSPNTATGDDKLWLKGGEGSMAVIRLFEGPDTYGYNDDDNNPDTPGVLVNTPNNVSDELDEIRQNRWLINDASLTFYLDQTTMNPDVEKPAYRIYLYDLKNKRRLVDYDYDVTTVAGAPEFNKFVHGGIYLKEDTKRRYTIKLTNHIRNLVDPEIDSTNVMLGLVVTESINSISSTRLKTPLLSGTLDRIPRATTVSQRGTVLYGGTTNVPDDKRLKLKIYYTKKD